VAGESRARGRAEKPDEVSESVCVGEGHRSKVGAHLQAGEPAAEPQGAQGTSGAGTKQIEPAKRLWKRRSLRELGNHKAISTFPQPRRRRAFTFGYITNGATMCPTVAFLNGSTGTSANPPTPPSQVKWKADAGKRNFSETASDAFRSKAGESVGIQLHRLIIRWSRFESWRTHQRPAHGLFNLGQPRCCGPGGVGKWLETSQHNLVSAFRDWLVSELVGALSRR
jgi:hypothetical protein